MGKFGETELAFLGKDEKQGEPSDKGPELVLYDLRGASEEQTKHPGGRSTRG